MDRHSLPETTGLHDVTKTHHGIHSFCIVKMARLLEVGVVLEYSAFPGFRLAFNPSDIMWDVNSEQIMERAREIEQGAIRAICQIDPDKGRPSWGFSGI